MRLVSNSRLSVCVVSGHVEYISYEQRLVYLILLFICADGSLYRLGLFLPAAGNVNGTSFNNVGSDGNYWSGTTSSVAANARYLFISGQEYRDSNRCAGLTVRPVRLVEVE